jgi:hypothetical protein
LIEYKTIRTSCRQINDGSPRSIVPYEVILFNNGIICKKYPHPVIASHMMICKTDRIPFGLKHESWPFGFNFVAFYYINNKDDPDRRVDFIETMNILHEIDPKTYPKPYTYEACSELKMGDQCYPRFSDKEDAFNHCMKLMIKEFNIMEHEQQRQNRCIKKIG